MSDLSASNPTSDPAANPTDPALAANQADDLNNATLAGSNASQSQAQIMATLSKANQWMPAQTIVALSTSGLSAENVLSVAQQMKGVYAQAGGGITNAFQDDVLQKKQTTVSALKDYITSVTGPPPIEAGDLGTIQAKLQAKGYGTNLPTGPWSQGWQGAYRNYLSSYETSQLAGDHKPASKSTGGFLHFLKDILPEESGDAIIGFVTSIPHQARQVVGDLAGATYGAATTITDAAVSTGKDLATGNPGAIGGDLANSLNQGQHAFDTVGGFVQGQTAEKHAANDNEAWMRAAEDLNSILMITGVVKMGASLGAKIIGSGLEGAASGVAGGAVSEAGSDEAETMARQAAMSAPISTKEAFSNAVRYGTGRISTDLSGVDPGLKGAERMNAEMLAAKLQARDLGYEDAIRGPGVVAKTMGRTADMFDAAPNGALNRFRSMINLPALERDPSWVGKLNDVDGMYYRLRTLAAAPYVWAPVRTAGEIVQKAGVTGAGLRLDAQGLKTLGGPNEESSDIQNNHTLNIVDSILKKNASFDAFGAHIAPSLDDLAYFLHAPESAVGASSKFVSDHIDQYKATLDNALGRPGVISAFERATGTSLKGQMLEAGVYDMKGVPEELQPRQIALNELGFMKHMVNKVHQFSLQSAIGGDDITARLNQMRQMELPIPAPMTPEWTAQVQRPVEESVLNDTDRMDKAREALTSDPVRLEQYIRREIVYSAGKGENELTPGMKGYLTAAKHMQVLKRYENILISDLHRDRNTALAAHQQSQADGFIGPDEPFKDPFDSIGTSIASKATLTRKNALAAANRFEGLSNRVNAITDPEANAEAYNSLYKGMQDYLFNQFGDDARNMPQDIPGMISLLRSRAQNLAADVWLPDDAPAEAKKALAAVQAQGYKLVVGNNIDWMYRDLKPLSDKELGDPLTYQRRLLTWLGVNTQRIDQTNRRMAGDTAVMNEIDALYQDDPDFHGLPNYRGATHVADLHDSKIFSPTPTWANRVGGVITKASSRDMAAARTLAEARLPGADQADIERMARTLVQEGVQSSLGIGSLTHKQLLEYFKRPIDKLPGSTQNYMDAEGVDKLDLANNPIQGMSDADAEKAAYAVQRGYARGGSNFQQGISHLDDMARGGFGFMAKPITWGATPGSARALMDEKIANLAPNYVRLRNEFRFNLSPELSLRKLFKTNLMLAANDVTPAFRSYNKSVQMGTLEQDQAALTRTWPGHLAGATAHLEKMLDENDVFHLGNHYDDMARAAGTWERQGLSDDEIRDRLVRVFGYGSYYGAKMGRSAAEQSMNFAFFPFSFDKKLYRNLGYFYLDHPAQTLLLTHAVASFDAFNQAHPNFPTSQNWIESHLPAAQELYRLNAFQHGVSLGQFGGVNAPVLNLFLPHLLNIKSRDDAGQQANAVESFIPALKFVANIAEESKSQGKIASVGFLNRWDTATKGHPYEPIGDGLQFSNIHQANVTAYTQLQNGYALYDKIKTDFADILAYNSGKKKALQYKFPMNAKFGEFAGHPVTDTTVRMIVNKEYPAFTVDGGALIADKDQAAISSYLLSAQSHPDYKPIEWVFQTSQSLARNIGGPGKITWQGQSFAPTNAERLTIQNAVRDVAKQIAEKDPRFKMMYDKYLTSTMGPLEAVT